MLQRVVFPGDDLDVVPLYVETKMDRGAAELAAEMAAEELTGRKVTGGTADRPAPRSARRSRASGSAPTCPRTWSRRPGRGAAR